MSGVGEILTAARLAKGASLEMVERDTKIKIRYLEALESGDFSALPAPAYARGYVRTYSAYLGLDPAEVLAEFNRECKVPEPQGVLSEVKVRGGAGPIVTSSQVLVFSVVAVVLVAAIFLIQQYSSYLGSAPAGPSATQIALAPTMQATAKVVAPSPTATAPAVTPTPVSGINVEVKIIQDCWMKVDVDGVEAYQGILKPGETKTWSGKDKVTMRAGFPSGVQVTVNGKSQGLLAPAGTGTLNITWTATEPQGSVTFITPPTEVPVPTPTKGSTTTTTTSSTPSAPTQAAAPTTQTSAGSATKGPVATP